MNDKTCNIMGVVVLYNPEDSIIENIYSYIDQVDHLLVVDNSSKENFFVEKEFGEKIEYIFKNSNIGVAAALNLGAQKALKKGFKFILTMDQDSKAPDNFIGPLLDVFERYDNVGIASPLHYNKLVGCPTINIEVESVNSVMTSGNLLSLEAYKKCGGFCEDYFLDYVDIEFCIRLHLNNLNILRLNTIKLSHQEASITRVNLFFIHLYTFNHEPFRFYYKTRNLLLLRREYRSDSKARYFLRKEYKSYFKRVVKVLFFEHHKFSKIKMILLGFLGYMRGEKGIKKFIKANTSKKIIY